MINSGDFVLLLYCTFFLILNLIALGKAKIVYNFGLSECNRVKYAMNDFFLNIKSVGQAITDNYLATQMNMQRRHFVCILTIYCFFFQSV